MGAALVARVAAWVFGREFADGTVKELLALPTSRTALVLAKLTLVLAASAGLALVATMTALLALPVGFVASAGRGYLPALGVALLTLVLAQILSVLGWGDWFPWAVPALASGVSGPAAAQLGPHSYLGVLVVAVVSAVATVAWWRVADHTR